MHGIRVVGESVHYYDGDERYRLVIEPLLIPIQSRLS